MKTSTSKNKIVETVVGAAVGAAIAGPAGAVAGGLVGNQIAARTLHASDVSEHKAVPGPAKVEMVDPMIHAKVKRILVPVDFSLHSQSALRFARDWAGRFGSEVCLLHVVESMNTFGVLGTEVIVPPPPPVDLYDQARSELEKRVHLEFPDPAKVSVHVRDGVSFDQITNTARELDVDLIIISTHGRTGLSHVLLGSTAERVVRHAPCPVLTLRCNQ